MSDSLPGRKSSGGRTSAAPFSPVRPALEEKPSDTASSTAAVSGADFVGAMAHSYRGEIGRSNTWRSRLDNTTNWAVITTGAALSFAYSSPQHPHFIIPANTLLVALFLYMEARRYRYYDIWSARVRLIEAGFFARLLSPQAGEKSWSVNLAKDLSTPRFTMTHREAIGRRLRRNYLSIFVLLALSWAVKVYLHPRPALSFAEFIERASIGVVPGWLVLASGITFNLGLVVFALATVRLREAKGTRVR